MQSSEFKILTAVDGLKKFCIVLNECKLPENINQVVSVIRGPLSVANEKLHSLERFDLSSVRGDSATYKSDIINSILDDFDDELQKAREVLKEVDQSLLELDNVLETTRYKLPVESYDKEDNVIFLSSFNSCTSVLKYFKLKSKILKHFLLTDPDFNGTFDPFCHWSDYNTESENALYSLGKLQVAIAQLTCNEVWIDMSKVIPLSDSIGEVLEKIRDVFCNPSYKRIFLSKGGEVFDVSLIRDDEVVFVSEGGPFIEKSASHSCQVEGSSSEWVKLNVGGQIFHTSKTTLRNREPESMLARMFDPDSNIQPSFTDPHGAYLIDRDPRYFAPLLNYLRSGNLILDSDINPAGVLEEANFFGIQSCIGLLQHMAIPKDEASLTRRDVINAIITTPNKSNLRFQGVNLCGADLSYLDLRNINFKFAKLRNAKLSYSNLSYCNFERADMTGVEMNNATLSGVRMVCATLENSQMQNCNFQDQMGCPSNMEGVNLRNAILEDSDLTNCNLRVSNLKHANLKSTILRGACLAGSDLEQCDLSGSDLHEANLRGANLKNAALEILINPLHMAQTVR